MKAEYENNSQLCQSKLKDTKSHQSGNSGNRRGLGRREDARARQGEMKRKREGWGRERDRERGTVSRQQKLEHKGCVLWRQHFGHLLPNHGGASVSCSQRRDREEGCQRLPKCTTSPQRSYI